MSWTITELVERSKNKRMSGRDVGRLFLSSLAYSINHEDGLLPQTVDITKLITRVDNDKGQDELNKYITIGTVLGTQGKIFDEREHNCNLLLDMLIEKTETLRTLSRAVHVLDHKENITKTTCLYAIDNKRNAQTVDGLLADIKKHYTAKTFNHENEKDLAHNIQRRLIDKTRVTICYMAGYNSAIDIISKEYEVEYLDILKADMDTIKTKAALYNELRKDLIPFGIDEGLFPELDYETMTELPEIVKTDIRNEFISKMAFKNEDSCLKLLYLIPEALRVITVDNIEIVEDEDK